MPQLPQVDKYEESALMLLVTASGPGTSRTMCCLSVSSLQHVPIYTYICMYIYIYIYIHVYVYMSLYNIFICVCIDICVRAAVKNFDKAGL